MYPNRDGESYGRSRPGSGRGGRGGKRGGGGSGKRRQQGSIRDCLNYKLLGECARHATEECRFAHNYIERNVIHTTVDIPHKVPMASALKGNYAKFLGKIAECCLRVSRENSVDIVVSRRNERHLVALKKEYEILLSQLYPIGPRWCYIHRDGVVQCETGALLKFRPFKGRIPVALGQSSPSSDAWELYITDDTDCVGGECRALAIESPMREDETMEGLHRAIEKIHGENEPFNIRENVAVKIIRDHETHMREMLKGGLQWFCTERKEKGNFILKLEARFGKVLWRNLPEDMVDDTFGIQQFAELCFSDTKHATVFNTNVHKENAEMIRSLFDGESSVVRTFDMKFTVPGQSKRNAIDIRIKFDNKEPTVMLAKRNEIKVVLFDVLCLHRAHDVRMSLNLYEMVTPGMSSEYRLVEQFVRTVVYDPVTETITFQPRTDEWNVNYVRHKKREAYHVDKKLLISVTTIQEYNIDQHPSTPLSLSPKSSDDLHVEIEFHNCSWDCAFGRDVGLPPEKCTALNLENPTIDPEVAEAVPHPWQPEHILEDFQEFLENLDFLNQMLKHSS